MHKKNFFKIAIFCFLALLGGLLFVQLKAKSAVASFLERKIPAHIDLRYEGLEVNLIAGNLQLSHIDLKIKNRDSALTHTFVKVDELDIDGFSHWQLLFGNTMKASEVSVTRPQVEFFPSKISQKETDEPQGVVKLLKSIAIEKIIINDGTFDMWRQENDSTLVRARNINFELENGKTNPQIIQKKIPLTYDSYNFSAQDLFVDLGPYESVTAVELTVTETNVVLTKMALNSKYPKAGLSRTLRKERDHIQLNIPRSSLKKIDFGFDENQFYFSSQFGLIEELDLNIYRDKLVDDDLVAKRMYSKMLRQLPIQLTIDSMAMVNGKIQYQENNKSKTKAGSLYFDEVGLQMKNIGNTYQNGEKTIAKATGKLMGSAPTTLAYNFDVNNTQDRFTMSGTVLNLNGEKVNTFLRPNLNARITGKIDELYFTTSGNRYAAKGNMKMKYANLEFELLQKDRLRINKLLSAIGNLFINDGSDTDAQGYRYGSIDVERDATKSLFNYIWISTQDGLLSTLTGDGKKEQD